MSREPITDANREEVATFIERHWGSRLIMSRGKTYYPHREHGIIDRRSGQIVGLATYRLERRDVELLTLNSVMEGQRIGTSLMLRVIDEARRHGAERVWLTTTNDNIRALSFYQRLGFRLTAVNVGAVDEARKIKPQIPITGYNGIPLHDEIILELKLEPSLPPEANGQFRVS